MTIGYSSFDFALPTFNIHLMTPTLTARLKTTLDTLQNAVVSPDGMRVDYPALARHPAYGDYRVLVDELAGFDPATLSTRSEKLAFWINLYNALMIDSVIRLRVKTSIAEGFLGAVRFSSRAYYIVGGQKITATHLEHGILRGNQNIPYVPGRLFGKNDPRRAWVIDPMEPRIHFALNCASNSCPPIRFYDPDRLDQQLDSAARNYLSSDVRFEAESHTIRLPMLFSWYGGDFGGKPGIIALFRRYFTDPVALSVLNQPDRIQWKYDTYDWGLNQLGYAQTARPVPNDLSVDR